MPGMDGTGPIGTGPIGWGRGPCRGTGNLSPRFSQRGFGRGFGWRFTNQAVPFESEEEILKSEVSRLQQALDVITSQLEAINAKKDQG